MKLRFLLLIIFIGSSFGVFAQESQNTQEFETHIHFSPEFRVSYNMIRGKLVGNGDGFGVGFYNAFFNQKRCNLIVGLEYNCLFDDNIIFLEGQDTKSVNHFIGIPVSCRVNMGKKVKFFVEAGAFFDPLVIERTKPIYENSTLKKETLIRKPNFGISGGIGLRIPVKKYEILVKSDYKWSFGNIFDRSLIAQKNSCWRFAVGFKM